MKKSFILYTDQKQIFKKLPDDIAGKLIKHIFDYVDDEDYELDDLLLEIAFEPIKQSINRDSEKWEKKLKQRSDAGKASANKRKSTKPTSVEPVERKQTSVEPRDVSLTDSVSDSVSVSDSDSVSDIKKDKDYLPPAKKAGDSVPFVKIVNLYHEILPELPRVEKLTETRKGYIKQRWKQDLVDIEHWKHYFDYVRQSPFLMGKIASGDRRPFKCTLEWLTKPANYAKVAEDMYHGE